MQAVLIKSFPGSGLRVLKLVHHEEEYCNVRNSYPNATKKKEKKCMHNKYIRTKLKDSSEGKLGPYHLKTYIISNYECIHIGKDNVMEMSILPHLCYQCHHLNPHKSPKSRVA